MYIKALIRLLLITGLSVIFTLSARGENVGDLEKKLAETANASERMGLMVRIGRLALDENPALARKYADEGLKLSQENQNRLYQAQFNELWGSVYLAQNEIGKATESYARADRIYQELKDKAGHAGAMRYLGDAYRRQGDYNRSIETYKQTIKLAEPLKAEEIIAECELGIGLALYESHKEPEEALKRLQTAEGKLRAAQKERKLAQALYFASVLLKQKSDFGAAEKLQTEALALQVRLKDEEGAEESRVNLSEIYLGQKTPEKAAEILKEGITGAENAPKSKARYLEALGDVLWAQNKRKEAIDALTEGIALAKKANAAALQKSIYGKTSDYLFEQGQYQKAYDYRLIYTQLKDSLFNQNKAKEIGRMESRFEIEKKIEEQKRAEEEAQRKEAETIARRNNLQYLAIFGSLAFLFVGLFLLGRLKLSERVMGMVLFFAFLLFFEFVLLLIDPAVDNYTGGVPLPKLAVNALLALGLAQAHRLLENRMRRVILRENPDETRLETN